jgi:preprotein translocase subunit SecE
VNPNKKWLDLGLGGLALAFWLVLRQILNGAWDFFRFPVQESLPVPIPEILAFAGAVIVFVVLRRQPKVNEFGLEVITELSKVTWPTRKETVISTGVIMVMVGIAAILLFVFDTAWGTLTKSFLEF